MPSVKSRLKPKLVGLYQVVAIRDEAVAVCKNALSKHPDNAALHLNLGIALANKTDQTGANKEFEDILKGLDMPWHKDWTGIEASSRKPETKHVYDELLGRVGGLFCQVPRQRVLGQALVGLAEPHQDRGQGAAGRDLEAPDRCLAR